jgi:hypothetical protein
MNLRDANIVEIEEAAAQWQDAEFEKYMRQFDVEPDAKVFDENSEIPKIIEEMRMEGEVYFEPSWQFTPTLYTLQSVILDRLEWGAEEDQFAISKCFVAAFTNEDKGGLAVEIAQSVDAEIWISDFFKREIENVPHYLRVKA